MLIEVTDEDIKGAARRNTFCCPVAKAVRRTLGHKDVCVGVNRCRIGNKSYVVPIDVRNRIHNFDEGFTMHPFEFEMEEE